MVPAYWELTMLNVASHFVYRRSALSADTFRPLTDANRMNGN